MTVRSQTREYKTANAAKYRRRKGQQQRVPRPFALQPLLELLSSRVDRDAHRGPLFQAELLRQAGMTRKQRLDWEKYGLTCWQADELAARAGYHASNVWPDWFELVEAEQWQPELFDEAETA